MACPPDLDLNETATYSTDEFKEAENDILSNAIVGSNRNITYRAGNQIHLIPNFTASGTNTYFHGFIHACNHSGNSFMRYTHNNDDKNASNTTSENYFNTTAEKIEKKKSFTEMRVHPNPNSGTFTINILNNFNPDNEIEISDLMGRKVFSKNFIKQKEILNLDLENGTYLIKYYDGINAQSQAIIINK